MSIKNLWALTPSEAIVAWELRKRGFHVFFPVKDVGIDLLIIKDLNKEARKVITVQVKGSRFYEWNDDLGGYGGWFQLNREKMERDLNIVDFYIFVLFHTKPSKTGYERFERDFFIIPVKELRERIEHYYKGGDKVNIYLRIFRYEGKTMVVDYRGISKKRREEMLSSPLRDYSHLKNWEKLETFSTST